MNKVLEILKVIKTYFLIVVIGLLLVFIYFKNRKIENLNAQLALGPKIEYVYNTKTDTIVDSVPYPVEVIKYKNNPKVDTLYVPLDLTLADSATIAAEYNKLFAQFAETKLYDNVLKDDSTAFIQLKESVQFNSIRDRELIFTDRTPVVNITTPKLIYTTSIVGGIEAGTTGVEVGAGLITKRNTFVKVSYDPFNKTVRGGMYFGIFNFKNK